MSRRGGLPNYSTLNDIVNQLISILLTKGFVSISGSLHLDFSNSKDPCCDSTAVISLSGRENLYRNSSKGRRQLSCRWPNHGVHDQPRVEHHTGTKGLSPNCSTTTELRWSFDSFEVETDHTVAYLNAFKFPIGADGMNSAGLSVDSLLFPVFAKFQVF